MWEFTEYCWKEKRIFEICKYASHLKLIFSSKRWSCKTFFPGYGDVTPTTARKFSNLYTIWWWQFKKKRCFFFLLPSIGLPDGIVCVSRKYIHGILIFKKYLSVDKFFFYEVQNISLIYNIIIKYAIFLLLFMRLRMEIFHAHSQFSNTKCVYFSFSKSFVSLRGFRRQLILRRFFIWSSRRNSPFQL